MRKIIITIDGYSSCGKSTLAKQLAKRLNYVFVDSGAMYRAITYYFLQNNIDFSNKETVVKALNDIKLSFVFNESRGASDMYLNGENVEKVIREMTVSNKVSDVAAVKEVREFTVAQQKTYGTDKGLVMDGRDIGTDVFPAAALKLFLTASPEIRVQRRFKEISTKDPTITEDEIRKNLEMRDYIDTNREISPLRKAEDAIVLDNSNLTLEDQLDMVLGWANEKIKQG